MIAAYYILCLPVLVVDCIVAAALFAVAVAGLWLIVLPRWSRSLICFITYSFRIPVSRCGGLASAFSFDAFLPVVRCQSRLIQGAGWRTRPIRTTPSTVHELVMSGQGVPVDLG